MKDTPKRPSWIVFLCVNAAALAALAMGYFLIPLLSAHVGGIFSFCFIHDICHMYCMTCGATRATMALLAGDLLSALRYHAALVWTYAALLVIDIRALVRILRKKERPFLLPSAVWWGLLAVFCVYVLVRNIALAGGWDWIGDFKI